MIYLRDDVKDLFKGYRAFDDFMGMKMTVVRDFKNRQTGYFQLGEKSFYIKKHFKAGLGTVCGELFHLRAPHIGAAYEQAALKKFSELGIDTMSLVAFGQKGRTLANQESFVVTDEISQAESLETICARWPDEPPSFEFKTALIEKVAKIARKVHENGMNHRDFYICHFLLDVVGGVHAYTYRPPKLFLIDLHRLQQRAKLPMRWRIKDIGGLYFSAMDIGLTRRDIFRFIRSYTGKTVRENFQKNQRFWDGVQRRAIRTYRKDFGKSPTLVIGKKLNE